MFVDWPPEQSAVMNFMNISKTTDKIDGHTWKLHAKHSGELIG